MSVYTFQLPAFTGSRSEEVFNEHSSYHGSKHIQGTLRESVMYPDTSRPSCTKASTTRFVNTFEHIIHK